MNGHEWVASSPTGRSRACEMIHLTQPVAGAQAGHLAAGRLLLECCVSEDLRMAVPSAGITYPSRLPAAALPPPFRPRSSSPPPSRSRSPWRAPIPKTQI